jgi:hypothetical protein
VTPIHEECGVEWDCPYCGPGHAVLCDCRGHEERCGPECYRKWREANGDYVPAAGSALAQGRHPLSQKFHDILKELGDLHDKKQKDYGRETDPFSNVRASEAWGLVGWIGAMVRATDKLKRLQKVAAGGTLANESVIDSFNDLAVYTVIARVLYEEEQAE